MELSNELFAILFSIVMVVAVVWFMRSLSRYKLWIKSRSQPTRQPSAAPYQEEEK